VSARNEKHLKDLRIVPIENMEERVRFINKKTSGDLMQKFSNLSFSSIAQELTKLAHKEGIMGVNDYFSEAEVSKAIPRNTEQPIVKRRQLRNLETVSIRNGLSAEDYLIQLFSEGKSLREMVLELNSAIGDEKTESLSYFDELYVKRFIDQKTARFDLHWGERIQAIDQRIAANNKTKQIESLKAQIKEESINLALSFLKIDQFRSRLFDNPEKLFSNFNEVFGTTENFYSLLLRSNDEVLKYWSPNKNNIKARRALKEFIFEKMKNYQNETSTTQLRAAFFDSKKLKNKLKLPSQMSLYGDPSSIDLLMLNKVIKLQACG
jgi:hypothetical protein